MNVVGYIYYKWVLLDIINKRFRFLGIGDIKIVEDYRKIIYGLFKEIKYLIDRLNRGLVLINNRIRRYI